MIKFLKILKQFLIQKIEETWKPILIILGGLIIGQLVYLFDCNISNFGCITNGYLNINLFLSSLLGILCFIGYILLFLLCIIMAGVIYISPLLIILPLLIPISFIIKILDNEEFKYKKINFIVTTLLIGIYYLIFNHYGIDIISPAKDSVYLFFKTPDIISDLSIYGLIGIGIFILQLIMLIITNKFIDWIVNNWKDAKYKIENE